MFITDSMIETIAGTVAKSAVGKMITWGVKKLNAENKNKFVSELTGVISVSCKEYESLYPIADNGKLPFYHSQIIVEEFVKFRFTKEFQVAEVLRAIQDENLILIPTEEELNRFFEIFTKHVNANSSLKPLNIEFNSQEEIFNISAELKQARNEIKNELKEIKALILASGGTKTLMEEWNSQLTEIDAEIDLFKAKSALDRLEKLEKRVTENNLDNNELLSKLLYLKTKCMHLLEQGITKEHALVLVKIFTLQPKVLRNKINAALAYSILKDEHTAENLSNEVLTVEPFNIIAWSIKIYLAKEAFEEKLKTVPQIVKERPEFVTVVFHWLRSHNYIYSVAEFEKFGLKLNIDYSTPIFLSPANLNMLLVMAEYLMYEYFGQTMVIQSNLIRIESDVVNGLEYAYKIYELSVSKIKGSEIEHIYKLSTFYFHCLSYMKNGNQEHIAEMEHAYEHIDRRNLDVTIKMMQAFNSTGVKSDTRKAIDVLNRYTGPQQEALSLIKAGNYAILGDNENKTNSFIEYLDQITVVDRNVVINFTAFIWHQGILINKISTTAIKRILDLAASTNTGYEVLLKVFCFIKLKIGTYTQDELNKLIETAKQLIDPADTDLSVHIAMSYTLQKEYEKAMCYLEPHINYNNSSDALKIFCKILYHVEGQKVRLLGVLKNWRISFEPDYELLKIELHLLKMQNEWTSATEVAEFGIKAFPAAEVFVHGYFISLYKLQNFEKINDNIQLIRNRTFTDESQVVNITNILIAASAFQESLDFLFRHASNVKNKRCRGALAMLSPKYPVEYFQQFEIVEIGHFVKYRVAEVSQILEITEENKDAIPGKYLIGKKVGESFSATGSFSRKMTEIIVERIMDKYVALMDEIVEEARNPLSGMGLQTFTMPKDNPSSFLDNLQDNLGVEHTIEKEFTDAELEAFHLGLKSFTEITGSVFKRNYIEAYFSLTQEFDKPFRVITPAINKSVVNSETVFLCDFTSLLLFFELQKNNCLNFESPLQIAPSTMSAIQGLIEETRSNPFPRISVSFHHNRVTPYFYQPDTKEKKLEALQEIYEWIQKQCAVSKVPEIIEYLEHLPLEDRQHPYMRSMMENRILADKENHVLITNDLFYVKQFQLGLHKIMSPAYFLKEKYSIAFHSCLNFMLSRNYVGIPITASMLKEEFVKFLSDQQNKYVICLENLRLGWNQDKEVVLEALKFIKELYVSSIIPEDKRASAVLTVLQYLTAQITVEFYETLRSALIDEFKLLPTQRNELAALIIQAIKMR